MEYWILGGDFRDGVTGCEAFCFGSDLVEIPLVHLSFKVHGLVKNTGNAYMT